MTPHINSSDEISSTLSFGDIEEDLTTPVAVFQNAVVARAGSSPSLATSSRSISRYSSSSEESSESYSDSEELYSDIENPDVFLPIENDPKSQAFLNLDAIVHHTRNRKSKGIKDYSSDFEDKSSSSFEAPSSSSSESSDSESSSSESEPVKKGTKRKYESSSSDSEPAMKRQRKITKD